MRPTNTTATRCYIVGEPGAPWTVGDDMDLAVGQGALLTDPLQMAVAYSTLATAYLHGGEGTVVTPHLGKQIDETNGGLLQSLSYPPTPPRPPQRADVESRDARHPRGRLGAGGYLGGSVRGLDQAEHPVYGKTGTAEHGMEGRSGLVHVLVGDPESPDRDRGDRRRRGLRRGNGGAGRASDGLASGSTSRTSSYRVAPKPYRVWPPAMPLSPIQAAERCE